MKPTRLLFSLLLIANFAVAQPKQKKSAPAPVKKTATAKPASAAAIHESAIVIDTHADTPQRFLDENFDLSQNTPVTEGHMDFDKIKRGNLGAEFFSIWVEPSFKGRYSRRAMDLIDSVYQQAARHPDKMTMAFTADDIVRAHEQHKFAALMGIEGGHAIENDMRLLRDFYRLGVRYMTLTWSNTNDWADSSGDIQDPNIRHHNGMTDFGKDVVREMNRLGMIVDVSHVSDATFFQALLISQAPVIASHSSSRALTPHPRNMTDDMLRAVTKNNGVVMINYHSGFLSEAYRTATPSPALQARQDEAAKRCGDNEACSILESQRINQEAMASGELPKVTWEAIVDHIDHVAKIAGVDHVGLGSDFDGATMPFGMEDASKLPRITDALLKKGYSQRDVENILGGNLLRVMEQVERVAKGGS